MIEITQSAQTYFHKLLQSQDGDAIGIRLHALKAGTPSADARLSFCDADDLHGDEWQLECEGFVLYVDAASAPFFEDAQIDFESNATGGQLNIRAPRIKGVPPDEGAGLIERLRHVIDTEINPQLAAHNGRVALEAVTAEGLVVLRFGGGCHGCGMVDVTLRQGIEKTLVARFPEITGVRDATDHDSGQQPYYKKAP